MPDYTDIFGDDFQQVLDTLDNLSPAQEALLLSILDDAILNANVFESTITAHIQKMMKNGMTNDAIETVIKLDLKEGGRLFGLLRNQIKASIVEGINQSARLGQYGEYDLGEQFTWVTVAGHRICADCSKRAGDTGTFEYHADKGLPGSGWSICREFCYCVLDPTGEISTNIEVPTESGIREKGAYCPDPSPFALISAYTLL